MEELLDFIIIIIILKISHLESTLPTIVSLNQAVDPNCTYYEKNILIINTPSDTSIKRVCVNL